MSEIRIGIDMGGTKIEAATVAFEADNYRFLHRERIPTGAENGYTHVVDAMAKFIDSHCSRYPTIEKVGIGMPGSVNSRGLVKNANTTCLNGRAFREDLQQRLSQRLSFANDANCFALAEARYGAGNGYGLVFGVIMGTGCGGGFVINGKLREGLQSISGEWGHTSLWPQWNHPCYCGKRGCAEQFISGTGIEAQYASLSKQNRRIPEILELEAQGESTAVECVKKWMDDFGRALSNVINTIDPDVVVLGGGVSNAELLYSRGVDATQKYVFSDEFSTPVLKHRIGDSAGVVGAALLP